MVITHYSFRNPLAGCKLRVCQCLIVPYLQGKGIGRKLLLAAYKLAEKRQEVSEVTVEDPAPAFQRLRDAVDFEWFQTHTREHCRHHGDHSDNTRYGYVPSSLEGEGVVEKVSKTLKIIPAQTSFLREFQQYASLTTRWNAISDDITRASYDKNRCGVNETK